jgi:hypothetical protein
MWALEQPWPAPRCPILAGTPLPLVATLGLSWLAVAGLVIAGWLPIAVLAVASLTAVHGGLLAVALAWGAADAGGPVRSGAAWITVGLVGAGATAAALDARGAVVLVAAPAWLAILALRERLGGLALGPGVSLPPVLVGGAIGALVGGHLLLSASQTLGYPLRAGAGWSTLLGLWAYDVGANVISAECFFRGALFNRLQRRWAFGGAAALATAVSLVRYVGDPLLPRSVEVMAGALFYLTLLGTVNCWLLWWSGSLVPGLVSAALFFLAYRALAIG